MATVKAWRGIYTDPETALYLDAVAAEVTVMCRAAGVPDFTVTPIPGCGSYQTTTAASAGTHAGGGAVDINAEPLTDVQARILESASRKKGGTGYFRPRTSPTGYVYGWQRHVHILRSDCADLSYAAQVQVKEYRNGLDALADNAPDTGNRSWVNVTWASVKAATTTPVATPAPAPAPAPAPSIPKPGSSTGEAMLVEIPGGQDGNPWREIPIPQDGRTYQLNIVFGGGPQTARLDYLTFGMVPTITTAPKVIRSGSWPAWQRDAAGRITMNPGEGNISLRWYGTADQTLSVAVYPVS